MEVFGWLLWWGQHFLIFIVIFFSFSGTFTSPIHETHGHTGGTGTDGTTSNIESDLKEKPDTNVYTGSREGYVPPPAKEGSGSGGKKKDMNNVAVKPDEKFVLINCFW